MCRLNILCSLFSLGKQLSIILRNALPIFVCTFAFHGGLYHVISLFLFLTGLSLLHGSYSSLRSYPLSLSAFWYCWVAPSNCFLSDEMLLSLLFMFEGKFFRIDGGWLLFL